MANPTVIGGNAAPSMQGMDLNNPNIINMIKAMQLAQYQGQQGEAMQAQGDSSPTGTQFVPAANMYAPARAIKQSMLVPAAGAIEKMTGSYMQQKAMQNQIALAMAMQQARDNQKFGTGATGMAAGSPPPTVPMAAAMTPQGVPTGSGAPPVPPASPGTPLPPPQGMAQAMGSIPPIAATTPGQPSNPPPGSLTASERGIPTPPQEANISTNGSVGGMPFSGAANTQLASAVNSPNMGGLGGNTPEAPTPVSNLSTGNPSPQPSAAPTIAAPLSTGNPNVPDGMSPEQARSLSYTNPEQYQKLLDAKVQAAEKNAELTPEQKNLQSGATGATEQQKNVATYGNNLSNTVDKMSSQVRILNAQEDLAQHFHPGAGETELAQAAAAAKALGASPNLVSSIARGDQNAIGSVQAFTAMASQHAAMQSLDILSNDSSGTPRVSQAMFDSFKKDLSNPDNQPGAIAAINALTRQEYGAKLAEQNAFAADKDPTTFRQRYEAQIGQQLTNGRSMNPAAAVTTPDAPKSMVPPPMASRTVGMTVNSPNGPVKWTGTGWMKVQNAQ